MRRFRLLPHATILLVWFVAAATGLGHDIYWTGDVDEDWHTPSNWDRVREPADGDVAHIDLADALVQLSNDTAPINGLYVEGGAELRTNGFRLWVDEQLATTRIRGVGSIIEVRAEDPSTVSLDTDELSLEDGGVLKMDSAAAEINRSAEIDSTSWISGTGTILFGTDETPAGTQVLDNSGAIVSRRSSSDPNALGWLWLDTLGGGELDLDGDNEQGRVIIYEATSLVVGGLLTDGFSGTLQIGSDARAEFWESWDVFNGEVKFITSPSRRAVVAGAPVACTNSLLHVTPGSFGAIESDITVESGVVDVDGTLYFAGDATLEAAATLDLDDATKLGIWPDQELFARVVTVNQSVINLDADDGNMQLVIGLRGQLILNVDAIDDVGANDFDGEIRIHDSGRLEINTPGGWRLDGSLEFRRSVPGHTYSHVAGTPVTVQGQIHSMDVAFARIAADLILTSTSTLEVDAGSRLWLDGETTFEGGIARGDGQLGINGLVTVSESTHIEASLYVTESGEITIPAMRTLETGHPVEGSSTYYSGGVVSGGGTLEHHNHVEIDGSKTVDIEVAYSGWDSLEVGQGATLNITGREVLQIGDISIAAAGVLNVDTGERIPNEPFAPIFVPQPWTLEGTLEMGDNSALRGVMVNVTGSIAVLGSQAAIDAAVTMESGTFEIEAGEFLQNGSYLQQGGSLTIGSDASLKMAATSLWLATSRAQIDGRLVLEGSAVYEGGEHFGLGLVVQGGDATFLANTAWDVDAQFREGSDTAITSASQLALHRSSEIEKGATFRLDGILRNVSGATLTVEDAAVVSVQLENEGGFVVGSSSATVDVRQWTQGATGKLFIELGGTRDDTFDVLNVFEDAYLDGTLNVQLIDLGKGVFVPGEGDSFPILVAGGKIHDRFANVVWPTLPIDLQWQIHYTNHAVLLDVQSALLLAGDYDADGDVDGADFTVWRDHLNSSVTLPNDPTPGKVTLEDYDTWKANFGNGTRVFESAVVPEPSSAMLWLGLAVIGTRLRRRRHDESYLSLMRVVPLLK